ncbi:MAG: nucleotidyltransferase family protein [Candidatus Calescibacterium sp.]
MNRLEEIKRKLVKIKPILQEKYKVKEIGIFGSYFKGKQRKSSDIDILTDFEEDAQIGLLTFVALENFLTELLGVKVDLVMKNSLKTNIGKTILKEVIYL